MKRMRLVMTTATTAAVLAVGSGAVQLLTPADDRTDALSRGSAKKDHNCSETVDDVLGKPNDTIYLYVRSSCKGSHGAKDPTPADGDWGDGAGWIKDFDNEADSLINNTDHWVAFYSKPGYRGDSFCVRPGRWVNKLYLYDDSKGSWSNSISSHKEVSGKKCNRRFG